MRNLNDLNILLSFSNINLYTICVSSRTTAINNKNWIKDASTIYSETCQPLAFSELQSTEKAQILKAYNLQGQEVPKSTKGEVIILLYDNGIREKTYIAE